MVGQWLTFNGEVILKWKEWNGYIALYAKVKHVLKY